MMCVACMSHRRFSFRRFWPFLLMVVSATASAAPVAEQGLGKGPIQISADALHGENKPQQQAVYTGNVVMTQGDVLVHADKLTIVAAGGKVQQATAVGNPVTFTMPSAQRHGYGNTLVYKPGSGEIVLIGNAHLWQKKNEISGQQVTYFLQTQKTSVTAAPGQRVQSIFYPAAANHATSGGRP